MTHIRHIRHFGVKIYGIHTHNKRNSPQTHDKILPITDLRHKLSEKLTTLQEILTFIVQLRSILLPCEF